MHHAFNTFKTTHADENDFISSAIFFKVFFLQRTNFSDVYKKLLLSYFIFFLDYKILINHILICYLDILILNVYQNFDNSGNEVRNNLSVEKGQQYRLSRNEIDNSRVDFAFLRIAVLSIDYRGQ